MPIQEQNIKLLSSEVMDDVPEGGGQATGNAIADGASNAIFPDISELDRTYGRVNLRKTFVGVQTPDTDRYFGANVIIADAPDDEKVSCTLFTTESGFDTRTAAASRIESYLFSSAKWNGLLFEDHIAGQRAISVIQREGTELPAIGKTLVLRLNEGAGNQVEQYIRVTRVTSILRTFTDDRGDFTRVVATCELSDSLRTDFKGHSASRYDTLTTGGAVLRDTSVADAARYYGASPMTLPAEIGDLSIKVASIFTQLVPSAQTEVPVTDVRSAGDIYAPIQASSDVISLVTSANFAPGVSLFVGGGIMPGTLTITGPATLTDSNGKLLNGATQVGTVDYINGIIATTSNTYNGGKTITYKMAVAPGVATESLAINVTAETRSLSIAKTLYPIPAPTSLQIHYRAQGRWYVIREQGTGAIQGEDSAFGAGQLSFVTGGMTVTFGALPDVGSKILLFWAQPQSAMTPVPHGETINGTFKFDLGVAVKRSSVSVSWNYNGIKTATENNGVFSGAAAGNIIDFQRGVFALVPYEIPPPGTELNINYATATAPMAADISQAVSLGNAWEVDLGSAVVPGTFTAEIYYQAEDPLNPASLGPFEPRRIFDDGAGKIRIAGAETLGAGGKIVGYGSSAEIGEIDYNTGIITYSKAKVGDYATAITVTKYVEVAAPRPPAPAPTPTVYDPVQVPTSTAPIQSPTPAPVAEPTETPGSCDITTRPASFRKPAYPLVGGGTVPEKYVTYLCDLATGKWVASEQVIQPLRPSLFGAMRVLPSR